MRRPILVTVLLSVGLSLVSAEGDLSSLFSERAVRGSIVIHNMNGSRWIYSDERDANRGTIPASTFKIVNSLIALEERAVSPDEVIKWDGKDKAFKGKSVKSWNADTNLESAFKNSTIWFYVELSRRIRRSTYSDYLRKCAYGNGDLSEKGDDFWNYGNMTVSPKNQVEFLTKLYKGELPFDRQNMALVMSCMRIDSSGSFTFRGKSGWGMKDGDDIGWLVGFLEKGDGAYAYATRISADSDSVPADFSKLRYVITLEAFRRLGIID